MCIWNTALWYPVGTGGTLWFYLRDHGEDMRKWDRKPTSVLDARVRELKGKTTRKGDSSRKDAAPVSRQSRRASDPLEGTSKSFLQEVSNKYSDQASSFPAQAPLYLLLLPLEVERSVPDRVLQGSVTHLSKDRLTTA